MTTTSASITSNSTVSNVDFAPNDEFLRLNITNDNLRGAQSPLNEFGLGGRELELMHHFSVNTATTLGLRDDVRQVWKFVIPQEGYRHPFIMDGLLAISALHKSLLVPSRRQEYLTISAHYQSSGMEAFAVRLHNVNEHNWKPVFSFAAVTILYVCMLPARCEDHVLAEPIHSLLELFVVTRGMRSFLQPFLKDLVQTSFAPLHHAIWTRLGAEQPPGDSPYSSLDQACITQDTFAALLRLRTALADDPSPARQDYLDAAAALEVCARLLADGGMYIDAGMVFIWPYEVSEPVVAEIRARSGPALLLVAYYCVFLHVVQARLWYFRGWAPQVLREVDALLAGGPLEGLMEWPRRQILGAQGFADGLL
ncbi:hypothetical protein ACHAQA_007409 [Verticillium albo-atrum]